MSNTQIDLVNLITVLADRVPDRQNKTGKISGRMFGSYTKADSLDSFVPGPFFSIVAEKADELSKRPKGTTKLADVRAAFMRGCADGRLHADAFSFRTPARWAADGATVKMTMAERKTLNDAAKARIMAAQFNVQLADVAVVPTVDLDETAANMKAAKRQGRQAAAK